MKQKTKEQTMEQDEKNKFSEITIKFGKGMLGKTFTGKDGHEYTSVKVPNQDPNDHRLWESFVLRANHIHENQFGKGMWAKLPADGHTTLRRAVKSIGEDGKPVWDTESRTVSNKELKGMVEAYKTQNRDAQMASRASDERTASGHDRTSSFRSRSEEKSDRRAAPDQAGRESMKKKLDAKVAEVAKNLSVETKLSPSKSKEMAI